MEVRDGTYYERINFGDKAVVVRSQNGPAVTTIRPPEVDGVPEVGSVVSFMYSSDFNRNSELDGFTVTGSVAATLINEGVDGFRGYLGAGILVLKSSPTINNCIVKWNNMSLIGVGFSGGGLPGKCSECRRLVGD